MKTEIIVGDTLDFQTTVVDYPATDGWTLYFRLVPRVSGSPILLTAAAATDPATDYRVQVDPATTAAWAAGEYTWNSYVKIGTSARYSVESGQVTLLPDPAVTTAPFDNRTHARIVLDAIEAVLENRATKDQQEYQIGDRMLKNVPMMELLQFRMQYKAEVRGEEMADRIANKTGSNRILTRFR